MPVSTPTAIGVFAFVAFVAVLVALVRRLSVKTFSASRRGVKVYDLAADLNLPSATHSRSYQIALYFTMKSLPREPAETPRVSAPAASR